MRHEAALHQHFIAGCVMGIAAGVNTLKAEFFKTVFYTQRKSPGAKAFSPVRFINHNGDIGGRIFGGYEYGADNGAVRQGNDNRVKPRLCETAVKFLKRSRKFAIIAALRRLVHPAFVPRRRVLRMDIFG